MLHITALMDNKPTEHKALIAEHGLSLFLTYDDKRILFDCGSGANPLYNAHKLGIDLKNLDAVVLSHSHYDHAAGFRDLIEGGFGSRELYTGTHFFVRNYAENGVRHTDLSAGFGPDFLDQYGVTRHEVTNHMQIFPGLHLITNFPRVHEFEKIPRRFVRRCGDAFIPDDFSDEICIAVEVEGGLAVLVGCSHPGILNMITHVHKLLGKPIKAVFGGTHLVEADGQRIEATVDALHAAGLEILGLSHCSGEEADRAIGRRTDIQGSHLGVGDCFVFV